mgnify:CR=1 FL=1
MSSSADAAKMWEELEALNMRLMSFALDALMEEGVAITPEQYKNALLRAKEWAKHTVWSHQAPPGYREALEEATSEWLAIWRAERARLYKDRPLPEEQ